MRKNFCIYIFIFSVILLNLLIILSAYNNKSNQEEYFRLHVVANSNSIEDQILKLNVSKKITNYLDSLTKENNITTKEASKKIITDNVNEIIQVANNEIKLYNKDYKASINIGKIYYDEKHSDTINMKEGIYDSIQIVLGEGKGENFWSLIFPYSYNAISTNSDEISGYLNDDKIEIKSGILEDIKKVVKLFS